MGWYGGGGVLCVGNVVGDFLDGVCWGVVCRGGGGWID